MAVVRGKAAHYQQSSSKSLREMLIISNLWSRKPTKTPQFCLAGVSGRTILIPQGDRGRFPTHGDDVAEGRATGVGLWASLTEVFENLRHVEVWEAARRGEKVHWQQFLAGYEVAVDWPACSFYEELMEAFPEAKVILTVREPEPWYASMQSTIYQLRKMTHGLWPVRAAFALADRVAPGATGTARLADHLVWEDTFDGRFEDKDYAIEVFERNNEAVRRRVPSERLLVFDVREGWGPLCDFLGVDKPGTRFPHLNETKEMQRRLLGPRCALGCCTGARVDASSGGGHRCDRVSGPSTRMVLTHIVSTNSSCGLGPRPGFWTVLCRRVIVLPPSRVRRVWPPVVPG